MSQCDQSAQLEHAASLELSAAQPSQPTPLSDRIKMQRSSLLLAVVGCLAVAASAERTWPQLEPAAEWSEAEAPSEPHARAKRTLFLKKKLIGAGLLGFGLGAVKGYKLGYHSAPEVHHVILAPPPPPVKYVEFVEKPIYLEKPVFKPHVEYEPAWPHPEPSPVYGPSW